MTPTQRAHAFCQRFGLRLPVLMAPMAGASPPALAAAVGQAGGLGACGALSLSPAAMADWVARHRQMTDAPFQINLWIPDDPPLRDPKAEAAQIDFLARFGPRATAPDGPIIQDFDAQFAALLDLRPPVTSSIMGLYTPDHVRALKDRGILWFATATTVAEARAAQAAGADAVTAQGAEAGGHRGAFTPQAAAAHSVGSFALIPALADAVTIPVIAAGGIGDARTIAAALTLGASAVTLGTALLRTPEAALNPAWTDQLPTTQPEDTTVTPAFTGRPARAITNAYIRATQTLDAPSPAPYPVQRALTDPLRQGALATGNRDTLYALAGQAARLSQDRPAAELVQTLWQDAQTLLP